ncbi:MAG: cation:proton antiporter regulatory subunit, partial [Puniceicoccales bacterium]
VALAALLVLVVGAATFFWKRIIRFNSQLEYLFMESFNQRVVNEEAERRANTLSEIENRYPWPVTVREITIPPGARVCGKMLKETTLRPQTGASVVALARDGQVLYAIDPDEIIFPGDHWYVFGSALQTENAEKLLTEAGDSPIISHAAPSLKIEKIYISREALLVDETLASADLRQNHGVNVVGIQRGENRITNPLPDEIIGAHDVLYVVGDPQAIKRLQEECDPAPVEVLV